MRLSAPRAALLVLAAVALPRQSYGDQPAEPSGGAVELHLAVSLGVEESYLWVESFVRLSVPGGEEIRLPAAGPRIPFAAPAVGPDGALDQVITAPEFAGLQARVVGGEAKLTRRGSGLFLDGVVRASAPVVVNVRYPLPHVDPWTRLAFRAPFTLRGVEIELRAPERYVPRLHASVTGTRESETGKGVVVSRLVSSRALPAGEILRIELEGVPVENPLWRQALTLMTILVGLGLFLSWLRLTRQEGLRERRDAA